MIFEIWKPVIGYEGVYSVSDLGRVRRECGYKNKQIKGFIGRLLKINITGLYPKVGLSINGKTKFYYIHHIVLEAFIGVRQKGYFINHKDGIKHNSRLSNLEYCTPSENTIHAYKNGLMNPPIGDNHGRSKLNCDKVVLIRKEYKDGCTLQFLADKYNVSFQLISKIINNRIWKHLIKNGI